MHKSRMYRCMIARWRRWNTLKFVKGSCGWYQGGKVEVVTSFLAWIKSNICGCVSMSNIILEFVYPIHNLLKGCGCSMIGWILRTEIMVFCEGQKLPLSILPGQGDLMLNLLILICLLVCRWLNHLKNTNTMNGRMKIEGRVTCCSKSTPTECRTWWWWWKATRNDKRQWWFDERWQRTMSYRMEW